MRLHDITRALTALLARRWCALVISARFVPFLVAARVSLQAIAEVVRIGVYALTVCRSILAQRAVHCICIVVLYS